MIWGCHWKELESFLLVTEGLLLPAVVCVGRSRLITKGTSVAYAGDAEALQREGPRWGQKPLGRLVAETGAEMRPPKFQRPWDTQPQRFQASEASWACLLRKRVGRGGQQPGSPHERQSFALTLLRGIHSKMHSFQGEFIQISPIDTRKFSVVTGKGKEGKCWCHSVNLPEEGEREGNKAMQHIARRKRNTGSFWRDSSWLGSKCSHDQAV